VIPRLRTSTRPGKQFVWLCLWNDVRRLPRVHRVIDAGCGPMLNRPMFDADEYVGIDPDERGLQQGLERFPDAVGVHSTIAEAPDIEGQVVVCTQVLASAPFDPGETIATVRALVRLTEPGGILLFNTSSRTSAYEESVHAILRESFESVRRVRYGAMYERHLPWWASLLIAVTMVALPALRGDGASYYACSGRLRLRD